MKQVIIRLKDVDNKTRAKFCYTTQAQFNTQAGEDVAKSCFMCGYELELKIGNQYRAYILHCDLMDRANDNGTTIEEETQAFFNSYEIQYYIKNYLPKY